MKVVHFPNLNSIRFIAAAMVILPHINLYRNRLGMVQSGISFPHAKLGVILFFVLSGFLITYLLLEEKKAKHTIAIRAFYIRRILRIWPLYFLVSYSCLFILPNFWVFYQPDATPFVADHFWLKFGFITLILPNLSNALFGIVPLAGQIWSIGSEEQFYLVWPWLMNGVKRIVILLITIILGYLILFEIFFQDLTRFGIDQSLAIPLRNFYDSIRFDCMAVGGLAGWVIHNQNAVLKYLHKTYVFAASMLLITALILIDFHFSYITWVIYSVPFAIVILNLATNPKFKATLEYKPLNYLGKISYGLYLLHPISIVAMGNLMLRYDVDNYLIHVILSFAITIALSSASFEFFESSFLKLKERFSIVKTRV